MGIVRRAGTYLTETIWAVKVDDLPRRKRFFVHLLRAVVLTVRGVHHHQASVWAASLTYISLMSLVPFVALIMGLGAKLGVPTDAVESFADQIPEAQMKFISDAAESFEKADLKALGIIALVMLLFAMVKALTRVEKAFNEVWGAERGRSFARRISNYVSVAVVAPLLIFSALVLSGAVMSSTFMDHVRALPVAGWLVQGLVIVGPYLAVGLAMTTLYWLMPNTRVRLTSALAGALVSGLLWFLVQKAYFLAQGGVGQLGIAYGAFAAIPMFLIWVYVSWLIVLLGAEVAYGTQHADAFAFEHRQAALSGRAREQAALIVARDVAGRFLAGEGPADEDDIAQRVGLPVRLVQRVLERLRDAGLISELEAGTFQVAKPPEKTTQAEVVAAVRCYGEDLPLGEEFPPEVARAVAATLDTSLAALDRPLTDLLDPRPPEKKTKKTNG